MSTVSLTLPSDGDTIDASDVNTPFNAIATVINGSIDNTNVSAGGLTPANLVAGTGTSWAWQSYTPTLTNMTLGNGTLAAKYIQIGKTVFVRFKFTLGSTSAVGTGPYFTLPVTAHSDYAGSDNGEVYQASVSLIDASTTYYPGALMHRDASTALIRKVDSSANISGITATTPFTWATADFISIKFTYEAA